MKRWKGLLIATVCVVGSFYVGDSKAMTCNVNYNGQTIKIDTNPDVVDAQEGWSSYSGGTPVCPPYIANSVIASIQAQSQVTEQAERREATREEMEFTSDDLIDSILSQIQRNENITNNMNKVQLAKFIKDKGFDIGRQMHLSKADQLKAIGEVNKHMQVK